MKQENVNMVIFSTCFKTDHFSEGERDRKRGRHKREAEREYKKYEKKKKELAHTRYKASPDLCVFQSVRCGQAVASSVCTQFHQELCAGADGLDTLQNGELDPSHCESTESTTT